MKRNYENLLLMRLLCMVFTIMLMVHIFTLTVSAVGKTYKIKDLGIQCTIPDSFTHVFSRDSIKSDADVTFLGMTKDEVIKLFSDSNIYLEAGTEYFETDFRITMAPITIGDFSSYGEKLLQGMASEMVEGLTAYGYTDITWEIYHHTNTEFIKMQYALPATSGYMYSIQYYTVMNLQAINFTCSFQTKPSSSDKIMLKEIVDSAVFDDAPQKKTEEEIKSEYPGFDYSDEYVTFHVPDCWHQKETDPGHTHLNAKFQRGDDSEAVIIYGCQDLWPQLTAAERQGHTREDFSFSSMTDNEIIETINSEYEMIGAVVHDATTIFVNDKKCGQVTFTIHNDTYGIPLDVTTTQVSFLEDGYMLAFSISQDASGSNYKEFRSVLESVRFHLPSNDSSKTTATSQAPATNLTNSHNSAPKVDTHIFIYLLGGAALLILSAITIMLIRKKKSAKCQTSKAQLTIESTEPELTDMEAAANQILFCHKCGSRLDPESKTCRNCGAVIPH